ncbi:MAG: DNA/RNA nuclease SfsA [Clostridiales bacterium]|nr:DNA/RNA nuclease SfsA [Clostridiales bacterium]
MRYPNITAGTFLHRTNRFVARVDVGGTEQDVHVKNTGRLKELFLPGTEVFLTAPESRERRTKYDLVSLNAGIKDASRYVNVDSNAPNRAAGEWLRGSLFSENAFTRAETVHGDSRFDFYVEDGLRRAFIEVKGVTLLQNGKALFPDAPTERGIKHMEGLVQCVAEGYEGYLLFIIQRKGAAAFSPNDITHSAFGDALRKAASAGVRILAVDCEVTPESMCIDSFIPVEL